MSTVSALVTLPSGRIHTYEANKRGASNKRRVIFGRARHNKADKQEYIAADDEPSTAKEVGVGAANPRSALDIKCPLYRTGETRGTYIKAIVTHMV